MKQKIREHFKIARKNEPTLQADYNMYILAKDSIKGFILLGGLDSSGKARMWVKTSDSDKQHPEYDRAPEKSYEELPL